ncbi:MAG: energy transducer TonB [Halioglobus sp.]
MYYQETEHVSSDRMGFAVFVAAAIHLVLILGLSFEAHQSRNYDRQLHVTLTTRPNSAAPDEAKHIAQSNQVGSGEMAERDRGSSTPPAPLPRPQAAPARSQQLSPPQTRLREVPVVSTASPNKILMDNSPSEQEQKQGELTGISPEVDRLSEQLASLEASLDDQNRAYADRPRVRRLSSVSAKRAVDAAYLHDWRSRLEAVGNKYYPEASLRYGIYGELSLLVVIRQDGSLENIQVLSSSGYAVLDEAAMKIVQLAAPFSPFPAELRATTDKLEIIRTWQFQENRLSSG